MLSALVVELGKADLELQAAELRRSELVMRARACLYRGELAEAETLVEQAQEASVAASLAQAVYLSRLEAVMGAVSRKEEALCGDCQRGVVRAEPCSSCAKERGAACL